MPTSSKKRRGVAQGATVATAGGAATPATLAGQPPIDLATQIAAWIAVDQLVIAALNPASVNPQVQSTLANAQAACTHLQLVQAHMNAANIVVQVSPTDPDFLTLSAIGTRVDNSIKNAALVSSALGDLQVLLSTVNQGFQIAHRLTT
jgi:hypothetical protein